MKLNTMQCWNEAMSILAAHKEAMLAIAGVFVFLPTLLVAQFAGQPNMEGVVDANGLIAAYSEHFNENAAAIILSNLMISFGGLALYFAIAPSRSGTVADSLGATFKAFLVFLIANIITGVVTFGGLMLFIIPGLYIGCRLLLVPMVIADRGEINPFKALRQSWEMTKDNGFAILLFILIVAVAGLVTMLVVQAVIGLITGLASGGEGWPLLQNAVAAFVGTAFQILLTVVTAGIYVQLSGKDTNVEEIFN